MLSQTGGAFRYCKHAFWSSWYPSSFTLPGWFPHKYLCIGWLYISSGPAAAAIGWLGCDGRHPEALPAPGLRNSLPIDEHGEMLNYDFSMCSVAREKH